MKKMIPIILALLLVPIPAMANCLYTNYLGITQNWDEESTFCGVVDSKEIMYACRDGNIIIIEPDCRYPCTNMYAAGSTYEHDNCWTDPASVYKFKNLTTRTTGWPVPQEMVVTMSANFDLSHCTNPAVGDITLTSDMRKMGLYSSISGKEWIVKSWRITSNEATCQILESSSTFVKWQCLLTGELDGVKFCDMPHLEGVAGEVYLWADTAELVGEVPKPPNPSPIVHFSWLVDLWSNFVSWLRNLIPAQLAR